MSRNGIAIPRGDASLVDAADRAALERLARYLLRPAISADRVAVRPDGRVLPVPPPDDDAAAHVTASMLARRLDWAALLERVFGADVTTCPRCAGPLTVLAFLTEPDVTARILDHLGLSAAVPPLAPARGPPADDLEPELPFADF